MLGKKVVTDAEITGVKVSLAILRNDIIDDADDGNKYAKKLIKAAKEFVYQQDNQKARKRLVKAYDDWLDNS